MNHAPADRRERERLIEEGRMATGNMLDHSSMPWWAHCLYCLGFALIALAVVLGIVR